uniref:GOLD domain-containing protein n=1 Tax=Gongylonema pulchrum TaxID=637853 RepID=A0A183EU86_9BILA
LLWHFTVNNDIEFSIVKAENGGERVVWPKVTLTSLQAPEQGFIKCDLGKYKIRFVSPKNSWFPTKLHYVVEFRPDCQ